MATLQTSRIPIGNTLMRSPQSHSAALEQFSLVISRRPTFEILLTQRNGSFELPRVTIPKWERTPKLVNERLNELWNLKTICLFEPSAKANGQIGEENKFIVLEACDPDWEPRCHLDWIPRSALRAILGSSTEAYMLEETLATADAYNQGGLAGLFARAGWLDDLIFWAQKQADQHSSKLTGRFRQWNASPFFSLVRLETTGRALWFKAVGEPNLREYGISVGLFAKGQDYFPTLVAARPEWNAWLMEEAGGILLENNHAPHAWTLAASTLGKMQTDLIGHTDYLLAIGCLDLRISTVIDKIDPFLYVMVDVMRRQTSNQPPALSEKELAQIGKDLKFVCRRSKDLGLPDSLGHCDLNPTNVLVRQDGCVFVDWAEAYVGKPFSTFEFLRSAFLKYSPELATCGQMMHHAYSRIWEDFIPAKKLRQCFAYAPLFAALSAAIHETK